MTIQILATLFIAFVVGRTIGRWRLKQISTRLFIFWVLFWLIALLLFWMPHLSDRVAELLQVGRGVDAIIYISLVVMFYLMFRIFNRFERMEKEMTRLVREVAIHHADKKK
jgi:small membrane protein